jgi:putative ABC transport system ATP-binding protein
MESLPESTLRRPYRAETAQPVLAALGLTKTYAMGEVRVFALRGVDLALASGELVVLLGASGSGKSTLLNILGGLDVPTSGRVVYRGRDLIVSDERAMTAYRRDHVGFVFQFYNLVPSLTARENVALVTDLADRPLSAEESLELVGLGQRLDHYPAQLSGGEQQRVAIARAIAKRPDVLLCDEPTGALDVHTGAVVLEVLERINRELGTTTVVITRNAAISAMADRVLDISPRILERGQAPCGRVGSEGRPPRRRRSGAAVRGRDVRCRRRDVRLLLCARPAPRATSNPPRPSARRARLPRRARARESGGSVRSCALSIPSPPCSRVRTLRVTRSRTSRVRASRTSTLEISRSNVVEAIRAEP